MAQSHRVEQGEYLTKIALKYGFSDEKIIWDYPKNAQLKAKRDNPNVLYPGDILFIPDKKEKKEARPTAQAHSFTIRVPTVRLRIVLKDDEGQLIKNAACVLQIDKRTIRTTTNDAGLIDEEVPASVETGELMVQGLGLRWTLRIGHLDPVDEAAQDHVFVTGIQARLNNLGFDCGPVDGVLGQNTRAALMAFQQAVLGRQDPTGEPDSETRTALKDTHGS